MVEARGPVAGSDPLRKRTPRGIFSPELVGVVVPALKYGASAGAAGTIVGVTSAIIKDVPPVIFGLVSGLQWYVLGSSYSLTRATVTRAWGGADSLTPRTKTKASAISGGVAGAVGGLLRGPRNIVPGAIMFTIYGAAGQGIVNKFNKWQNAEKAEEGTSWLRHKYSPLRKLTDEEYEALIREKMLKVETEVALIDDKIAELRAEAAAKAREQFVPGPNDNPRPETIRSEGSPKLEQKEGKEQQTSRPWRWW